ncbi:hypothetical protein CIB84_001395 [Bambusicola thoracicus]|uniref:Rab3 GTPase-activating protein catalytic subunit n=1 Tax=Bambusicola thoracicus TaxID=9083 RepID=A0A2P4TEQ4_BAMTH|nr:hypothetical protein CIB84_001395 [Bambusicola thoracicus]
MAADSEPESEVFEITDFTTASEWERFISKIEEVLNDWKLIGISSGKPLEKGVYTTGVWEEKSDEISFADFKFSVTHHYLVQEPGDRDGKEEGVEDIDALVGGEVGGLEFGKLPFGACEDPISELHLATTWPHLTEGIIVDNDVYSDLDPIQAPQWSVRVRKADNPQCLLGDFLNEFFKLCRRKESTDEILGRSAFEEDGKEVADITHALSKLTEPAPVPIHKLSVTNMVHSAKKKIRKHRGVDESPLNNEVLNTILLPKFKFNFFKFLFPDAADKLAEGFESRASTSAGSNPPPENEDYNLFSQFKSAPSDSLTYKLALCLCMINFYHGGVKGVAHLWQEFVLEMRYRWENNYLIPGLANGPPDLRCCLLHQKLQMLNCCIERKKARDEGKKGNMSDRSPGGSSGDTGKGADHSGDSLKETDKEVGKSWESWSDSEEEFFECLSDTEDLKGNGQENGKKGGTKEGNKEPVNLKPEGRLHPHGKLTLLHPGEPLYIPITQEPAPMTEDLLEEQSEVLAKLGTSAEGAHLRARMQSACLLSDMESFKAANPGCCLEDFVRWYSPRDYIEEEVVDEKGNVVIKGELSARMKIPSNMWVEAWETAKPVPARRQKRLFDDTREAEKVLHYLAVQKPADLARHLLPCIIHAAVLKVKEEEVLEDISSVKKIIKQIISHSSKVLRFPNPEDKKLEEIIAQIMSVEAIIARARSLKAKFGVEKCENEEEKEDLQRFVNCLLEQPEVSVLGAGRGPAGSVIHKLFVNAQRISAVPPLDEELRRSGPSDERRLNTGSMSDFPPPTGREIILRTTVPRPAPYSKPLPQRMYSVLTKEDFRLAGAFSADTTFF